jgi:hypothetical protein
MSYTVKQAASALGVAYSTITLHCRRLSLPKHGLAWLIDDAALERLRASIVGRVGNPNWTTPRRANPQY